MHALCGAKPSSTTFTLKVQIGNTTAHALVDSGSDASFISTKFVVTSKCQISEVPPVQVIAANGMNMLSTSSAVGCHYTIQGEQFSSDFWK